LTPGRPTSSRDVPLTGESSSNPVVLFVATRWELAALRRSMPVERRINIGGVRCFTGRRAGRVYWLVATGIGPGAADKVASTVLNRQKAALVVSTGFAGSLATEAAVGDVVVATSVMSGTFDGGWQGGASLNCADTLLRNLLVASAAMGVAVKRGAMVSLSGVLCRAADKQQLGRVTGAIAVDMESAAIAIVAKRHDVPFVVVRAISDAADENLPLDFNVFLKPCGWLRGIGAVIRAPASVVGLNRLRRHSRFAADRLAVLYAAWAADEFGLSRVLQPGKA
jgi:adenosylhomocysteine nucleosidase